MDEYLYILVGILWIAFSFYQQSQKKKRQEAARRIALQEEDTIEQDMQVQQVQNAYFERPVEEVTGKTDFKRALEEILLGGQISLETIPKEEAQSLETIPENEYVQESKTGIYSQENEIKDVSPAWSEMGKRSKESVEEMQNELEETMVLQEDTTQDESMGHYFNLRNAVIYAEILNTKYVN
jgi:hypothetical protein